MHRRDRHLYINSPLSPYCKDITLPQEGQIGTDKYLAPEIVLGDAYNNSIDIYSLGVVFYEFGMWKLLFTETNKSYEGENTFDVVVFTFSEVKFEETDDFPSWLYIIVTKMWITHPPGRINCDELVGLFKAFSF